VNVSLSACCAVPRVPERFFLSDGAPHLNRTGRAAQEEDTSHTQAGRHTHQGRGRLTGWLSLSCISRLPACMGFTHRVCGLGSTELHHPEVSGLSVCLIPAAAHLGQLSLSRSLASAACRREPSLLVSTCCWGGCAREGRDGRCAVSAPTPAQQVSERLGRQGAVATAAAMPVCVCMSWRDGRFCARVALRCGHK